MENDLDPAYDRDTAVADLTRISTALARIHFLGDGPGFDERQEMAADLNQVSAYLTRRVPSEGFVILIGNPVDGFNILGLFATHEAAMEFGERTGEGDWWITNVQSVEGD